MSQITKQHIVDHIDLPLSSSGDRCSRTGLCSSLLRHLSGRARAFGGLGHCGGLSHSNRSRLDQVVRRHGG